MRYRQARVSEHLTCWKTYIRVRLFQRAEQTGVSGVSHWYHRVTEWLR